ncbi:hypothetical protein EYF80_057619 [Liparis tanakae]|uniref:Uncharacterized protein n=1 Tax=Liparis tanakae TaxID=230148 RepID=A0A4Z2EUA8_9TELE|nr:hypothetical protein EYF80_057619 [Liparis tanakae]
MTSTTSMASTTAVEVSTSDPRSALKDRAAVEQKQQLGVQMWDNSAPWRPRRGILAQQLQAGRHIRESSLMHTRGLRGPVNTSSTHSLCRFGFVVLICVQ